MALRSEARPDSISLSIDGARWTDKFIACHMKWVIPTSACRYSNFLREIAASEDSFMQQCTPLFSARTATRLAATGAVSRWQRLAREIGRAPSREKVGQTG